MIKKLKLTEIATDAGTQVRAALNQTTVAEYAEALAAGAKFPPIVVFCDGTRHLAADGFHRIQAAQRIGAKQIECDLHNGSKTDALRFALGCNAHHGLRRTNADKRHAVVLALSEFPKLSDVAISDLCLVGRELVAEIRKLQIPANQGNQTSQVVDSDNLTRIGKDGKAYRLPPPPMQRSAPPSQVLDGTGWPIPTQLIPLWKRADEVQEMLTALSRIKGALRTAQDAHDKLYAEVSFSSALSQLDQAWAVIKTAKPFAVCPNCQGQLPDQCTLCKGRGLISEHRWKTCVPSEDKAFRAKVKKSTTGTRTIIENTPNGTLWQTG